MSSSSSFCFQPSFSVIHAFSPDDVNSGLNFCEVLVGRCVAAGYDDVLLGDMEMKIRNMVGWREEDVARGDEESLVILDDESARASHAGRRLQVGLLLSTIGFL